MYFINVKNVGSVLFSTPQHSSIEPLFFFLAYDSLYAF